VIETIPLCKFSILMGFKSASQLHQENQLKKDVQKSTLTSYVRSFAVEEAVDTGAGHFLLSLTKQLLKKFLSLNKTVN